MLTCVALQGLWCGQAKFAKCLDDRDVLVRHNNTVCCQEFAICSSPTGYGDCEVVKLEQGARFVEGWRL